MNLTPKPNIKGTPLQTYKHQITSGLAGVVLLGSLLSIALCLFLLFTGRNLQGGAGLALGAAVVILLVLLLVTKFSKELTALRTPAAEQARTPGQRW